MKARYASVALLLCVILIGSLGLSAVFGMKAPQKTGDISVVVSFYPLHTAAQNVVGSCDGVTVSCLTQPTTGCLHDYQMTPAERALLDQADILVQNGAGMESFLEPVLKSFPELTVIDTSKGVSLLACEEHEHHDGHDHGENAHLWVDPACYSEQVRRLRDGLCAADPVRAEIYVANAAVYLEKIEKIAQQLREVSTGFTHALLFHDSMAYAAKALQLEPVGTVPLGEERFASAAELAAVANALTGKSVLFLYDDQYPAMHESLTRYASNAKIVRWNIAVQPIQGVADKDAWIYAMRQNIQAVKEAVA